MDYDRHDKLDSIQYMKLWFGSKLKKFNETEEKENLFGQSVSNS
jgi:hypothetical protein